MGKKRKKSSTEDRADLTQDVVHDLKQQTTSKAPKARRKQTHIPSDVIEGLENQTVSGNTQIRQKKTCTALGVANSSGTFQPEHIDPEVVRNMSLCLVHIDENMEFLSNHRNFILQVITAIIWRLMGYQGARADITELPDGLTSKVEKNIKHLLKVLKKEDMTKNFSGIKHEDSARAYMGILTRHLKKLDKKNKISDLEKNALENLLVDLVMIYSQYSYMRQKTEEAKSSNTNRDGTWVQDLSFDISETIMADLKRNDEAVVCSGYCNHSAYVKIRKIGEGRFLVTEYDASKKTADKVSGSSEQVYGVKRYEVLENGIQDVVRLHLTKCLLRDKELEKCNDALDARMQKETVKHESPMKGQTLNNCTAMSLSLLSVDALADSMEHGCESRDAAEQHAKELFRQFHDYATKIASSLSINPRKVSVKYDDSLGEVLNNLKPSGNGGRETPDQSQQLE